MDTIGQTLKKARESKKMTVTDVAHATNAMVENIQAIEADAFHVFPAPIYAVGFIKLYAECVGMNPQPLVQAYRRREAAETEKSPAAEKARLLKVPEKQTGASWPRGLATRPEWLATLWQTALKKVWWPAFKPRGLSMADIRLPEKTWKTILASAGMALLVLIVVAVVGGYALWNHTAEESSASRWLQEPPAPYLDSE